VGGSGGVGRWTADYLRSTHPNLKLLIGGRDRAKAEKVAAEVGGAEGVALDMAAADLGLGDRQVSAVAVFPKDDRVTALRFALSRMVPHLGISGGIVEIGPEVAAFADRPNAAAVVLGAEWLVGATTVPTLKFAKAFGRLDDVTLGAVVDEKDAGGPATTEDFERLEKTMPQALILRGGSYVWHKETRKLRAVDGTEMEASAFSPFDVVGLGAATGAPNVRFHLATGVSSSRRNGGPPSTEILIELAGQDHAGRPLRTRHAVVHPGGHKPLTGLGVAMLLERLVGLDGRPPTPAGLYFPYQLLEPTAYLARLGQVGGRTLALDVQ
jgi:hypothetical protein